MKLKLQESIKAVFPFGANSFVCPICGYRGRFKSVKAETGERKHARCPRCGSLERHRLQYLVFKEVAKDVDTRKMSMLHFAPEDFFRSVFKDMFKIYLTADLNAVNVDRREDLTRLSMGEGAFDFVYASHVLEHIKDDMSALSEIRRILKPGGMAIIPVPVIGGQTIEYGQPNPHESGHVRCPGEDYYQRYNKFFGKVQLYKSIDFDAQYQLYIYEDRSRWPGTMPRRPLVPGAKHVDGVPVCFK